MLSTKLVLLAFMAALAFPAPSFALRRVEANVQEFTLLVEFFDGGHCSATKTGRNEILIANHCLDQEYTSLILNKTPVNVTSIKRGPGDQARVTLDTEFKRWAVIGARPEMGDDIFIFGNPGEHRDQLRRGYISGTRDDGLITAMIPIWKGDSGSAVFNSRGQIVAIVVEYDGNQYYTVAILQPLDGK